MPKLKLQIITPERVLLSAEVDSVSVPTQMGEITLLPNHIPLVANLAPGELVFRSGDQKTSMLATQGVAEVRPGNEVVILADAAEEAEEVNEQRAEEARARARKIMSEQILSDEEYAAAAGALERSLARLRLARKHRSRTHTSLPQ